MKTSFLCLTFVLTAAIAFSQDRLPFMPGYKEFVSARSDAASHSPVLAHANGSWESPTKYQFTFGGKSMSYDADTHQVVEVGAATNLSEPEAELYSFGPHQQPARGRQFSTVTAPDGTVAKYSKGNVSIVKGGRETPVTTDGSIESRVKYGTGSWVYGEELEQRDAMGFSGNSRYLWYYRFDEKSVPDYFVLNKLGSQLNGVDIEAYPKPGHPNPKVDVFVYDTKTGESSKVPVRLGEFSNDIGHYVFGLFWRKDKSELLFERMNRRQNQLELCAYNPATKLMRVVFREQTDLGWVDLGPLSKTVPNPWLLGDNQLLAWSQASGYFNYISIDLDAGTSKPLTNLKADVMRVLSESSSAHTLYYMAQDGDKPYQPQLHRLDIDSQIDTRLTDPAYAHSVQISPDGKLIADEYQRADAAPALQMLDRSGRVVKELAKSNVQPYLDGGYSPAEMFSFTAKDGQTPVYGYLHKPRNFDPKKKYPVLLSVYGGPLNANGGPSSQWRTSIARADYGFLVVEVYNRGTEGRGRDFRQVYFHNMGGPEIDDFASAVQELAKRPYVDAQRVGIEGTSYGGYSSAMAILRYPDVFAAASVSSMVSDWRNYDTAYTERYMGLVPEDKAAYDKSSVLTYAKNLKGWLMIYYGTADDNTHASNVMQFINALQGKSFEVQVGVDRGHSGLNGDRMMEFFIERLVMSGPRT